MSQPGASLPSLTVNRQFMYDFVDSEAPCFGLGLVEEGGKQTGFLAMRVEDIIPESTLARGFRLGHQLLGSASFEVVYFGFEFYGFKTYNAVLNPASSLVKTVLQTMIESKDYFFFLLGPSGGVTTFRADIGMENLAGLKDNLERILASETTEAQYERFLAKFEKNPTVAGTLLNWVCRDEDYLDLEDDRLELNGAAPDQAPESEEPESRVAELMALRLIDGEERPAVQWHPLSRLPLITQLIDEGVKDAKDQYDLLLEGKDRPYLFDDETIDRIILLRLDTLEFVEIYQEQLERWQKEKLSKKQEAELIRLAEQCRLLKTRAMAILAMADEIAAATVDKIAGMDEMELALKVLLGEIPLA